MQDSTKNDSSLITCLLLLFAGMMFIFQGFTHAKELEDLKTKDSQCQVKVETMERTLLLDK